MEEPLGLRVRGAFWETVSDFWLQAGFWVVGVLTAWVS